MMVQELQSKSRAAAVAIFVFWSLLSYFRWWLRYGPYRARLVLTSWFARPKPTCTGCCLPVIDEYLPHPFPPGSRYWRWPRRGHRPRCWFLPVHRSSHVSAMDPKAFSPLIHCAAANPKARARTRCVMMTTMHPTNSSQRAFLYEATKPLGGQFR